MKKLVKFLEDARLELSNNLTERSIKPFVIGRRSWLFANIPRRARTSAVECSLGRIGEGERLGVVFRDFKSRNTIHG